MVEEVGDEKVAHSIQDHGERSIQLGVGGLAVVAGEAALTGSCDGGDGTLRADLPHAMVAHIRDEEVAGRVESQPEGLIEPGLRSGRLPPPE
jgi:hypothetical protein